MSNDIRDTLKDLLDKVLDHLGDVLNGNRPNGGRSSEPELIPIPVRNDDEDEAYYHG